MLKSNTMYLRDVQIKQNVLQQDRAICLCVLTFGTRTGFVPIVVKEIGVIIIPL